MNKISIYAFILVLTILGMTTTGCSSDPAANAVTEKLSLDTVAESTAAPGTSEEVAPDTAVGDTSAEAVAAKTETDPAGTTDETSDANEADSSESGSNPLNTDIADDSSESAKVDAAANTDAPATENNTAAESSADTVIDADASVKDTVEATQDSKKTSEDQEEDRPTDREPSFKRPDYFVKVKRVVGNIVTADILESPMNNRGSGDEGATKADRTGGATPGMGRSTQGGSAMEFKSTGETLDFIIPVGTSITKRGIEDNLEIASLSTGMVLTITTDKESTQNSDEEYIYANSVQILQ